jgi:hypothetical protein
MRTYAQIIEAFGGYAKFADAIEVPANKAAVWRHRDSIPPAYWSAVCQAAAQRGIAINLSTLAEIAATRSAKTDQRGAA